VIKERKVDTAICTSCHTGFVVGSSAEECDACRYVLPQVDRKTLEAPPHTPRRRPSPSTPPRTPSSSPATPKQPVPARPHSPALTPPERLPAPVSQFFPFFSCLTTPGHPRFQKLSPISI